MCVGLPMQLVALGLGTAVCRHHGGATRRVNTLGLEAPAVGDWVLVHRDTAVGRLDAEEARAIEEALAELAAALAPRPEPDSAAMTAEAEPAP